MAEDVACPECGEEVDPRGLNSHMVHKHPNEESEKPASVGGTDGDSAELEVVEQGADTVTLRSHHVEEIRVADEESKQELVDAWKERIRGNSTAESDEIEI